VLYTYAAAGTNTVRLIVSGLGGSSTNTKPNYIFVSSAPPPPVAIFTGTPTNGTEPLVVTFIDTSTGSITNRFWDFGDGGTANVTTNSVAYTYYAGGTYDVTLIVRGPDGASTNTQPNYINVLTTFQAWQIQYFGSTNNPTADADGDGQNNFDEFQAGTDPTNSASVFRITSVVRTNDDIQITWKCGSKNHYIVQSSSPLADGSYTNDFTNLSPLIFTSGGAGSYVDSGGATNVPARYYRVLLYQGPL
jgi:PKD repeat protein